MNSSGHFDQGSDLTVLKQLYDLRLHIESGKKKSVLVLGLSAALDTVDHGILLNILEHCVGSGLI